MGRETLSRETETAESEPSEGGEEETGCEAGASEHDGGAQAAHQSGHLLSVL